MCFVPALVFADSSSIYKSGELFPSTDIYGRLIVCDDGANVRHLQCDTSGGLALGGSATSEGTVAHAVINVDGADSDVLVAALAAKKIKVLGYTVLCDGAVNITFEDGDGTDVTGDMPIATNGGVSAAVSQYGQFETPVANKSLNLLKSAAQSCDGHLTYMYVD